MSKNIIILNYSHFDALESGVCPQNVTFLWIICIKKVLLSIKTFVSMNSSRDIFPNSEIRYFESWSMSQLERAAICSG